MQSDSITIISVSNPAGTLPALVILPAVREPDNLTPILRRLVIRKATERTPVRRKNLSNNALYIDLSVSSLTPDSDSPAPGTCLTKSPAVVSRIASGFNSLLRTLIDSGSSHCFVSRIFCELNGFVPYSISPVKLRYLDGSTSLITEQIRLLIRFPSGDVHLVEFYVTLLDSPCDLVLGYSWLHRFNLLINWSEATIAFRTDDAPATSVSTPRTMMSAPVSVAPTTDKASPNFSAVTPVPKNISADAPTPNTSSPYSAPSMEAPSPLETNLSSAFNTALLVSLVSAAAYSAII